MSFIIDVLNAHDYPVNVEQLQEAANRTLVKHDVLSDSVVTVVIANDEEVQNLNRQHRGVDKPTDVLSFPTDLLPDEIDESPYLGDIIIAYPYTKDQNDREGFEMADSLVLMVVHGTLHLLGYDHDTEENRAEMWEVQAEVLNEMNINLKIVPTYEQDHDD
jgi:probable rRNA maturation factor